MRFLFGWRYALAGLVLLGSAGPAVALEVFATSFFSPDPGSDPPDPDPELRGVLRVDLETGAATRFIDESAATGLQFMTDVVVDPATDRMYVSTLTGFIFHFDATTGQPLPANVVGPPGAFAALPTQEVQFGNGYASLALDDTGRLVAATNFGSITPYRLADGLQETDLATGIAPPDSGYAPTGLDQLPDGDFVVAVGNPFGGAGTLVRVGPTGTSVIVNEANDPSVRGGSNPTTLYAAGDFDRSGLVDEADYDLWADDYGTTSDSPADANGDGLVDAADYTIWRDSEGEAARVVLTDLGGNKLVAFDPDGTNGQTLAIIPPDLPEPLPPMVLPSNSPSEVLVTPQGTLLVSTLGLTQRPDNRGALLEYDRQGNLLSTIASGLPAISGIAIAPPMAVVPAAVPEPAAAGLLLLAAAAAATRGRG